MDVVVLGHSFIRRLRDGLIPPKKSKRSHDIPAWNTAAASQLTAAWGMSQHIRHIYTFSDGVTRIRDIDGATHMVERIRPGIVLMDIGSNDLAHVDSVDPSQMLRLATHITDTALTLSTHKVIINAILPRTGNITCTPAVFRENASHLNSFLKNICDPKSRLVFHKPRGFWTQCTDAKERPCEVSEWSSDGIHCDMPDSARRYSARTRRAILTQVHWARNSSTPSDG